MTPRTSASGNVGDPYLFPLFWDGRGKVTQIDPARYRILTVEAGLPQINRSLPGGSIGRIVWRALNEPIRGPDGLPGQTVALPWVFNSKAGENMVAKNTIDMKDLRVETTGSTGQSSWTQRRRGRRNRRVPIRSARIRYADAVLHEADQARRARTHRQRRADVPVDLQQSLGHGFALPPAGRYGEDFTTNATQIVATNAAAGAIAWNTARQRAGRRIPGLRDLHRRHQFEPGLRADQYRRRSLERRGRHDQPEPDPAELRDVRGGSDPGADHPPHVQRQRQRVLDDDDVDRRHDDFPVERNRRAAISIAATGNFAGGTTTGLINVQSCTNPSNSRAIAISVTSLNSTNAPFRQMDTPAEGATVSGSIAVTGWATDDVEVVTVRICRDSVGDTTTPTQCGGQSKVYIGDAIFIDDARSDIEAGNPTTPLNYRAGWGYLMLTNFLPNQGNGPVTLHAYAIDREGNVSLIGSKSILTDNLHGHEAVRRDRHAGPGPGGLRDHHQLRMGADAGPARTSRRTRRPSASSSTTCSSAVPARARRAPTSPRRSRRSTPRTRSAASSSIRLRWPTASIRSTGSSRTTPAPPTALAAASSQCRTPALEDNRPAAVCPIPRFARMRASSRCSVTRRYRRLPPSGAS